MLLLFPGSPGTALNLSSMLPKSAGRIGGRADVGAISPEVVQQIDVPHTGYPAHDFF